MTDSLIDPYAYPPRGLDRLAAARYVGFSPGAFDSLVKIGRFPRPRRFGDEAVWDRADLDAAFEALPVDGQPEPKREAKSRMSEQWPGYHNVYTPETLAERWQCSGQHIRNMIKRGQLSAFKYGGKLTRISAADVVAYETANTVKPTKR